MSGKKWFRVTVPVTRAYGHQEYLLEAESVEDAIRQVEAGDVPVSDEHLEVETVADPELWEIQEMNYTERPKK